MTLFVTIDPDVFGLSLIWTGPLKGHKIEWLDVSTITLVILNLVFVLEWGGNKG